MKLAVLGAGAWGTALAISFSRHHETILWTRSAEHAGLLADARANQRYLPGINLPSSLRVTHDLGAALDAVQLIVLVTSTAGMAPVLTLMQDHAPNAPLVWACTGFETSTGRLPHQIADALLPPHLPRGPLSGPSFALEVAQGKPAALTLASTDAHRCQNPPPRPSAPEPQCRTALASLNRDQHYPRPPP